MWYYSHIACLVVNLVANNPMLGTAGSGIDAQGKTHWHMYQRYHRKRHVLTKLYYVEK